MSTLIVPSAVVNGEPMNIQGLLRLKHRIPDYQRDYVWTKKVVEQLWDDLFAHYKKYSNQEKLIEPEGYFLGAMVVILDKNGLYEVVDGQQRLTSLTVIMSVLLDHIDKLDINEPCRSGYNQVAKDCLAQFVGNGWESNLQFSDNDMARFFLGSCVTNKTHDEKKNFWSDLSIAPLLLRRKSAFYKVREAIEIGYTKLDEFLGELTDQEKKIDRFSSLFRLVTECVVILKITAHSHPNAYSIFESLNNRGIRLSQADLIKNVLLKEALPKELDEILYNWASTRENVDSSEILTLPEFLHYSYISRRRKVKANELFENVKSLVNSSGGAALEYSKTISDDAIALNALTSKFSSYWTPNTTDMLKDITNVLGVKLSYPFLFAVYRKYDKNPQELEKYVRLIMNFSFRFLKVIDGSVETLAHAVNEAALLVNSGGSLNDVSNIFRRYASDSEFEQELETASFSNTKLAYFVVYYLEKIQMAGSGVLPLPHGKEQNLEHIMPRTPTKADWPNIFEQKSQDIDLFNEYLWRIGNLLPLPEGINKSLKNKGIAYKIDNKTGISYSSKDLKLISPGEVSNYLINEEWTYGSIEARQKDLVKKYALQAWKI